MAMKSYADFDAYLADQDPRQRAIIRALRGFVKREAPHLEESVKWGNGCWLDGGVPVSYVYAGEDHVQFGFFAGSSLKDPEGLLRGEGKFVRHVRISRPSELRPRSLRPLLAQAARRKR